MEQFIKSNKYLSSLKKRKEELNEQQDSEEDLTTEESSSEEGEEDSEVEQENKKGTQKNGCFEKTNKQKNSDRELRPRHKLKNGN